MLPVSLSVSIALAAPIVCVSNRRNAPVAAIVLVPKATMDKNYLSPGNKDEVGLPWRALGVKRITIAHGVS